MALKRMLGDLRERFDKVLNVNSVKFIPTYVIATALDPRYKGMLNDDELASAKFHLLREV